MPSFSKPFRTFRRHHAHLSLSACFVLFGDLMRSLDKNDKRREHSDRAAAQARDESGRFLPKQSDLPHAVDPDALTHLQGDPDRRTTIIEMLDGGMALSWLDGDPVYEIVETFPGDPELGEYDNCHVWSPIDFDPCELYAELDVFDEDDYESDTNRVRSPRIWFDIDRPHTRRPLLLMHNLPGQLLEAEIKLVNVLAGQIRTVPDVEQAIRPTLIQMALTTVTIDGETILTDEDHAADLSTLQLLYLIVHALVGERLRKKMIWKQKEAERRRNSAPPKPKKAKKSESKPKAKKVKKPKKTKEPPKKTGPNVWGILKSFLILCLDEVRPLVRQHETVAIRTDQFPELERWAASRSDNEREQFLCRWRIQIIRLACELLDANREDEHANRGFVVALSFVGTPKGRRSADTFDARDIIRFLEGHPDPRAADLLAEFKPAWNDIVGTEEDEDDTPVEEPPAVAVPTRTVERSPEEELAALMESMGL